MKSIFTCVQTNKHSAIMKSLVSNVCNPFKKLTMVLLFSTLFFSVQVFGQGFTTIDFHQAQNDRKTNTGLHTYIIDWVNGILNATHTDYFEGIGVPQRIVLTGILPNAANSNPNLHSLRFQVLAEKDKKHAYDFPISWEQAFKTAADIGNGTVNELQNLFIQECGAAFSAQGLAACDALKSVPAGQIGTASFPDVIGNPGKPTLGAPNVDANISCFEAYIKPNTGGVARYGDRKIEIRGNAAISNVAVVFNGYKGSGKDLAEYMLTWESTSDMVMIRFATRLAPGTGTCGYGSGQGAGSISGGPYHVTLERLDDVDDPSDNSPEPGVSMGSQDNQIMSNAIQIPPPECGLSPGSSGCTTSATSFTVNYTSTDAAGATVKFYFVSNTAGAKIVVGATTITAAGNCSTNVVSVVADFDGKASVTVVPVSTNFTAGSFLVGACVTTGSGSTACQQSSATTIDEASVVAKVNNTVTTAAAPYVINANLANPTATLTALASLNGLQDNAAFSSFLWTVAPGVTGNIAVAGNLGNSSTATATFTPTLKNPGPGYEPGLYAFDVTVSSTANNCPATARVFINVTSGANCPADITGPSPVCQGATGLVYSSASLAAKNPFPEPGLTYTWSIDPAANATITSASVNVTQVTVTAGNANFAVKVVVTNANGETFTSASCQKNVTVVAPPTVSAIYNPPACDSKVFTVDVPNSNALWVYSITQPGNVGNVIAPQNGNGGTITFSGLTAGDGFVVTVSNPTVTGTCTGSTNCASSTNSCASAAKLATTAPETSESLVEAKPVATTEVASAKVTDTYSITLEQPTTVKAVPNPFTDKIRFNLVSSVSGNGSLELFNVLGQKVGTVYSGYVQAGQQLNKEYNVPVGKRNTLIYVFRVGDQKVTGRLVGLK